MINLSRLDRGLTPAQGLIQAVCYVEACPSIDSAVDVILVTGNEHKRLRSIAVKATPIMGTKFVELPKWDRAACKQLITTHSVTSTEKLEELIQTLSTTDISFDLPLWRIDLVENNSGLRQ